MNKKYSVKTTFPDIIPVPVYIVGFGCKSFHAQIDGPLTGNHDFLFQRKGGFEVDALPGFIKSRRVFAFYHLIKSSLWG